MEYTVQFLITLQREIWLLCKERFDCFAKRDLIALQREIWLLCKEKFDCFAKRNLIALQREIWLLCEEKFDCFARRNWITLWIRLVSHFWYRTFQSHRLVIVWRTRLYRCFVNTKKSTGNHKILISRLQNLLVYNCFVFEFESWQRDGACL